MKKRILSILLLCCMMLTLLPTAAFAAVSDSLGNTPEENQAILEQLSALTGGSSDQVLSMLNALGLLDEDGNFKVDQTITLDGQVLTLVAVVSFAAAAAITALCFRLRNRENQKKGGADKPNQHKQEGKTT